MVTVALLNKKKDVLSTNINIIHKRKIFPTVNLHKVVWSLRFQTIKNLQKYEKKSNYNVKKV